MRRIENPTARHILVADLGGGTFDVCIVRKWVEWDEIHMLFTSGDERLGGNDFDNALTDWCLKHMSLRLRSSLSKLPLPRKSEMKRQKKWPLAKQAQEQLRLLAKKAWKKLEGSHDVGRRRKRSSVVWRARRSAFLASRLLLFHDFSLI